ncbi:MAG: hypothetical protein ACRD0Z_15115 [Acidimicrobiales bacterium]
MASRAVVVAALVVARLVADRPGASASSRGAARSGLLAWDAQWYERIAAVGYGGAGREALRFFPLLPLAARALALAPGIGDGTALLIIANAAAFVALALLYLLARYETKDEQAARRAPWFLALFPAGFVLVMGYAGSLLLVTSLVMFLCLRTGRFAWAGLAGLLAGLCRPVGLLLAVPALVEAARGYGGTMGGDRLRRTVAVIGAPAGTAVYLTWSKVHDGSFLLPFREQVSPANRGGIADPLATIERDLSDLVHLRHIGTGLHAPWALVLVLLALVVLRRWPACYGAYAVVTLAVALTAPNLTSLERYGLGCFPFILAITSLTGRPAVRWTVLAVSTALLVGYSMLAFLGSYVP